MNHFQENPRITHLNYLLIQLFDNQIIWQNDFIKLWNKNKSKLDSCKGHTFIALLHVFYE